MSKFPPCPPNLKAVQHFLKLASDYEPREPAIAFWARLYALQTALKIDSKSPEAKTLLTALMDWLEKFKQQHRDNEAITTEVAGQAVLENEGHKLFTRADTLDRSAQFDKNLVKIFYTAGVLFDVIEVFGELTEEIQAQRKYTKWKATYIHNCLKNGEIPIPGPLGGESEDFGFEPTPNEGLPGLPNLADLNINPFMNQDSNLNAHNYQINDINNAMNIPPQSHYSSIPAHIPDDRQAPAISTKSEYQVPTPVNPTSSGYQPTSEDFTKAQKFCRFAGSALDYEDKNTAIDYITKALNVLNSGKEV